MANRLSVLGVSIAVVASSLAFAEVSAQSQVPDVPIVFANSASVSDALSVSGSGHTIPSRVHSNKGMVLGGSGSSLGPVTFVGTLTKVGGVTVTSSTQVGIEALPSRWVRGDYEPGVHPRSGKVARRGGQQDST